MENYKRKLKATVIRQEQIQEDIFSLVVQPDEALFSKPGQFFQIFSRDNAHLLGRPISLCDMDKDSGSLRFVYQKKGYGTSEFSRLSSGDNVVIMGPLGNGFPVDEQDKEVLLVGGGMGVAPLLLLAKVYKEKATVILGYRDFPFLKEDFVNCGCKVITTSDSGNEGIKGTVIDALNKGEYENIKVFSCGPLPMLKALKEYSKKRHIELYVSMEERMACGIGVCLGCVTDTVKKNNHYRVNKVCVCKDGPVFLASEIKL